jgi:transcriptional regulator with XRE-family HTH domain
MNHTNILLDKYREVCSLRTDMAAAAKLGVGRGTVSAWRHGNRHAEPESVEAMAKAAGLDAEEWVLRVQADRESTVNPKRAQVWLRCAQRISASAAGIALALGLAVYSPKSHAESHVYNNETSIHYAKYWMESGCCTEGPAPSQILVLLGAANKVRPYRPWFQADCAYFSMPGTTRAKVFIPVILGCQNK